ncbi:hypothetical protein HRbin19_00016 [bacterium HR19]|nr:hypothetical protein HRbin19_00016 [bacterium HR19]
MDIREIISRASKEGIRHYGDSATLKFYDFLKERKFMTTKCRDCSNIDFPPRNFCTNCFSENIEWIEIPKRGRVYAFTNQKRALRFVYPDIIGFVEIEGVGRILTKLEGEDIKIGDEVEWDFQEVDGLTLHIFRKVKS